jgi:hypothetical protein
MVYSQVCFHAILGARLTWDAGCLGWCKERANWHRFQVQGAKAHQFGSIFRILRPPEPVCRCCSRDYTSTTMDSGRGLGWIQGGSEGMKLKTPTY